MTIVMLDDHSNNGNSIDKNNLSNKKNLNENNNRSRPTTYHVINLKDIIKKNNNLNNK